MLLNIFFCRKSLHNNLPEMILLFWFVQQFGFIFFRCLKMAQNPFHLLTSGSLQRHKQNFTLEIKGTV